MASVTFLVNTTSLELAAPMNRASVGPAVLEQAGGLLGDGVHAPVHVGVGRLVVAVHGVDHRGRLLRRGGRVQVDQALAVDLAVQDREVLLDGPVDGMLAPCFVPFLFEAVASSGPPLVTIRPSISRWTTSGRSWSRIRW